MASVDKLKFLDTILILLQIRYRALFIYCGVIITDTKVIN